MIFALAFVSLVLAFGAFLCAVADAIETNREQIKRVRSVHGMRRDYPSSLAVDVAERTVSRLADMPSAPRVRSMRDQPTYKGDAA